MEVDLVLVLESVRALQVLSIRLNCVVQEHLCTQTESMRDCKAGDATHLNTVPFGSQDVWVNTSVMCLYKSV